MSEWCYRATSTKVTLRETRDLAVDHGFLYRCAFKENGTRVDNTTKVEFGDVIHLFFASNGHRASVGSFEVVGLRRHPHPQRFVQGVRRTVLFEVAEEFAQFLASLGTTGSDRYQRDPVLKKITGWPLISRPDLATPTFGDAGFTGQSTLIRRA